MLKHRAVGIDLGTTYSAVAWVDDSGHSSMVVNADGDVLTPSVVLFDDDETIVGKEARKVRALSPERVAETVKRDMGQPRYSRPIRGEHLRPEVIQGFILRRLKDDIQRVVGPNYRAVITVPAYFDEPRRRATAQAGAMAGLELIDIVNEPTAAALAFGEQLGYLSPSDIVRRALTVLVYDLGGGTFDVTIVDLRPGEIRAVATDGDVWLGGCDWDRRLADLVAERFLGGHPGADPRKEPVASARLLSEVEEAKRTLTARRRAVVCLEHQGQTCPIAIDREEFESATADLVERTAHTTRQVLAAAGRGWEAIDRILLVGGATRMPMVAAMLERISGKQPDHTVHPDEAVARGAALYARWLLLTQQSGGSAPFDVVNINSHSLGIEAVDPQTQRKYNEILIPRNTPLPARVTRQFVTRLDNQPSIVIQVLEGESRRPQECARIGRTALRNLPSGLPKGSPVDVTYEYGINGRLSVLADMVLAGRKASLELEQDSALSDQGVQRWQRAIEQRGGMGSFEDLIESAIQELLETEDAVYGADLRSAATAATAGSLAAAAANLPSAAAAAENRRPPRPDEAVMAELVTAELVTAELVTAEPVTAEPSGVAVTEAEPPTPQAAWSTTTQPEPRPNGARSRAAAIPAAVMVAGHIAASLVGLAIGYYVLCCIRPDHFNVYNLPLPSWAAGQSAGRTGRQGDAELPDDDEAQRTGDRN